MMGEPVRPVQNRREPHIVLQSRPEQRFRATIGCNQMIGRYESDRDTLTFGAAASTMMACPPLLDAIERQLRDVLSLTQGFRQDGQRLELQDADGTTLAEFLAVYLR